MKRTLARLTKSIKWRFRTLLHVGGAVREGASLAIMLRREVRTSIKRPVVAIVLTEHLGDIVACEPVQSAVRERHADATILWFTKEAYLDVVRQYQSVDRTIPVCCVTVWIVLKQLYSFDAIYELHFHGRECILCRFPLVKAKVLREINSDNYLLHGNLLSTFSRSAGLALKERGPVLLLPEREAGAVEQLGLPSSFVAVHTTSQDHRKDWALEKWADLVERLIAQNVNVVEIGLKQTVFSQSPRFFSVCGQASILQTAEILRKSSLFIGVDSGPAHLANAVGIYGIILLGPLHSFSQYNPFSGGYSDGSTATLIRDRIAVRNIPVDSVYAAALRRAETAYRSEH